MPSTRSVERTDPQDFLDAFGERVHGAVRIGIIADRRRAQNLASEIGERDGALLQAEIDANGVGFVGIEVKKAFLAAPAGRGCRNALLVDELVLEQPRDDLGDRAAFQPGPGGDIDAGNGLAFTDDVEDQNLIEIPQRLVGGSAGAMDVDFLHSVGPARRRLG